MKVIILAAGRGSRLEKSTEAKPKCLTTVSGKPLLEWQLEALNEAKVADSDITLVSGYLGEQLKKYVTHQFTNERWASTNMVRSLMCAESVLEQHSCIVLYSDILYDASMIKPLLSIQSENIVVPYNTNWLHAWSERYEHPLDDLEGFSLHADKTLKSIGGRASSLDEIEGQFMGVFRTSPTSWAQLANYLSTLSEQMLDKLDTTSMFQLMLKKEMRVETIPYQDRWFEVDTPADRAYAERELNAEMMDGAEV